MRFLHLVFDGVADGPVGIGLDVVGAVQRLREPRSAPRQDVVSVDGKPVRTATGRRLSVDGALSLRGVGAGDVLLVPGLGTVTEPAVAAALARDDVRRGVDLVARAASRRVLVAASCSATFVVAAAGLLDEHEATTTWWLAAAFARRFPRVTLRTDRLVVDAGGVVTAGSAFAHADLMLALVARTMSPALAHLVARYLVLDERASQSRYVVIQHLGGADPTIRKLERFITERLDRPITLEEMACATATSTRTLARRVAAALGTTPNRFAQRLRVARAAELLETSDRSVDDIAAAVGYADAAAFRRVFRRETGESPRARRLRVRAR